MDNGYNLIKMEFNDSEIDEVLRKDVRPIGTGCHVTVPKRHEGKKCVVIILKKEGFFND